MLDTLLDIALDLTAGLSAEGRYQRLVEAVRRALPCDAAALLRLDNDAVQVVAASGLTPDALGRRFLLGEQPRLAAILAGRGPVRFAARDPRPDPYEGLIAGVQDGSTGVHSCMGAALWVDEHLVGALTVDAVRPGAFNDVDDQAVATLAALAAAAMRTAGLIDALEGLVEKRGQVSQKLVAEALQRGGGELIGQSPAMEMLRQELQRVAPSDLSVLITGETGVGKELVARTIHARSSRAHQPLVYINCAALPESIAESELFGHVRGAFTGAMAHRMGRFELADGGTLFLDEIGELPLGIQAKLLHALQRGEVQRVGADHSIEVDVRVLAATNRELDREVAAGRFRADLFHRLCVYPLRVPPLREREGDIALLAGYFMDRAQVRLGSGPVHMEPAVRQALERYPWPGNVRELEHMLLRATIRAASGQRNQRVQIQRRHLDLGEPEPPPRARPCQDPPAAPVGSLREATEAFQQQLIRSAVAQAGGNWAEAARRLDMDRANLHRLARRLGLK